MSRASWLPFAAAVVVFSGFWGAFSSLPTDRYRYPAEMVYVVWAIAMLVPACVVTRKGAFDYSLRAAGYGLSIGLTGAGGQLLLLRALVLGPAYLVFPIVALSPAITVMLAVVVLRERIRKAAAVGVVMALLAILLFARSGAGHIEIGAWLPVVITVTLAWGVQAFLLRKAALAGISDSTSYGYMTLTGLLLVPVALTMIGGARFDFPWQAPALAGGIQLLNAIAALFLVMALSRGDAALVVPVTSALSPVLTTCISLAAYHRWPTPVTAMAIVLALAGSALTAYARPKTQRQAQDQSVGLTN